MSASSMAGAQAGAPYVRPRVMNCCCSGGHRGRRSKAYSKGGGSESRFSRSER